MQQLLVTFHLQYVNVELVGQSTSSEACAFSLLDQSIKQSRIGHTEKQRFRHTLFCFVTSLGLTVTQCKATRRNDVKWDGKAREVERNLKQPQPEVVNWTRLLYERDESDLCQRRRLGRKCCALTRLPGGTAMGWLRRCKSLRVSRVCTHTR